MGRSMSSCESLLRLRWRTDGLSAHEDLDDGHRRTTTRTDEGWLNEAGRRIGLREGRVDVEPLSTQQLASPHEVLPASGVGDQPVVTDAVKAAGQNMQ